MIANTMTRHAKSCFPTGIHMYKFDMKHLFAQNCKYFNAPDILVKAVQS
jgi:hypothetical protein